MSSCLVCGDELDDQSLLCGRSEAHGQCAECVHVYVGHCVDQAVVMNTLPIKCPIPDCGFMYPEDQLLQLMNEEERAAYEVACIRVGVAMIEQAEAKEEVRALRCPECDYLALYSKGTEEFWESIERDPSFCFHEMYGLLI